MLYLRQLRETKGVSQAEVARIIGISRQTYNNYELGKREADYETLLKLAEYFDTSVEKILTGRPELNITPYTPENMIPIPVIGKVAAGYTCLAETDIECYELVSADTIHDGYEYVYLRVVGDSMEPLLLEGDLVLVRVQNTIDSGAYAVVIVDEEDGVVKRIKLEDKCITLISQNPYYPPREFEGKDKERVRIFGKVVESKRKF